jgi:hypothetical protein
MAFPPSAPPVGGFAVRRPPVSSLAIPSSVGIGSQAVRLAPKHLIMGYMGNVIHAEVMLMPPSCHVREEKTLVTPSLSTLQEVQGFCTCWTFIEVVQGGATAEDALSNYYRQRGKGQTSLPVHLSLQE